MPKPVTGKKFRRWRKAQRLGLNETARLLGLSPVFLCDFEYGRRHMGPENAVKLERFIEQRAS